MSNHSTRQDEIELIRRYYPCYSRRFVENKLPGYSWSTIKRLANAHRITRLVNHWVQPVDDLEQGDPSTEFER